MAINKNALMRYKVLDNCFRNPGRNYFIEDLINECNKVFEEIDPDFNGISRRQIFQDIAFMESAEGWSINLLRKRDGKRVYYRYEDMSFSINNMPLNEIEINHLQNAIDILSQFKGLPQFDWISELIQKLKQGIDTGKNIQPIISFDSNLYLKGIEHLGTLYNAIYYKKVLEINYRPFQEECSFKVIIHPYFLKQFNNRWFLFGYNPITDKYNWNLALDRIVEITESRDIYHENSEIDWIEYFEDIIGVTKPGGGKPERIVLHFKGKSGKYIVTKPLHGSQKSRWISADLLEVKLDLMVNYEFESQIISYAEDVQVIETQSLREKIYRRLNQACAQYSIP
jgi:predicted DNA-binding transcriptional regulator YafY